MKRARNNWELIEMLFDFLVLWVLILFKFIHPSFVGIKSTKCLDQQETNLAISRSRTQPLRVSVCNIVRHCSERTNRTVRRSRRLRVRCEWPYVCMTARTYRSDWLPFVWSTVFWSDLYRLWHPWHTFRRQNRSSVPSCALFGRKTVWPDMSDPMAICEPIGFVWHQSLRQTSFAPDCQCRWTEPKTWYQILVVTITKSANTYGLFTPGTGQWQTWTEISKLERSNVKLPSIIHIKFNRFIFC